MINLANLYNQHEIINNNIIINYQLINNNIINIVKHVLIGLHFIHFLDQLSQAKTFGISFMSILDGIAFCI